MSQGGATKLQCFWLVVEPNHLKNMLVQLDHFSQVKKKVFEKKSAQEMCIPLLFHSLLHFLRPFMFRYQVVIQLFPQDFPDLI